MNNQYNTLTFDDINDNQEYLKSNAVPAIFQQKINTRKDIDQVLAYPYDNIKAANDSEYSIMDFNNFWLNWREVSKFILQHLNIDIEIPEDLSLLNKRFQEAMDMCENRYLRKIPQSIREKKLTLENIPTILWSTGTTMHWVYYCIIAKILFWLTHSMNDTRVSRIMAIHQHIDHQVKLPINITKDINILTQEGEYNIEDHSYNVTYSHRAKSSESVAWKMIGNIEYKTVDNFYDLHWHTIEIDSDEPTPYIKLLEDYYLKWKDIATEFEIENKDLLTFQNVEQVKNSIWLDMEFYNFILVALAKSEKKTNNKKNWWKWVGKTYQDIKIKAKLPTKDPRWDTYPDIYSWVELKLVKKWNINEYWLAMHSIFDYKKRFREINRLWSYIRRADILHFVNDFFHTLDDILNHKWIDRYVYLGELFEDLKKEWSIWDDIEFNFTDANLEKKIAEWLFKHFEKDLIKTKATKRSKSIFYVHKYYLKDVEMWIAPELEILEK